MTTRTRFAAWSALPLALVLTGAWGFWSEDSPCDAWSLDEQVRIITNFVPERDEVVDTSFRLRNTTNVPLRILGASTC